MASALMNNQLLQLKKLGKDVEALEKKLHKAFENAREEKVLSNVGVKKNVCSSGDESLKIKSLSSDLLKNDNKKGLTSQSKCNTKSATVEVTVKTKRNKNPKKFKTIDHEPPKSKHAGRSKSPKDTIARKNTWHCCCKLNSKNIAWSNILKQSEDPKSEVVEARERSITALGSDLADDLTDSVQSGASAHVCSAHRKIYSHRNNFNRDNSMHDSGNRLTGRGTLCDEVLSGSKSQRRELRDRSTQKDVSDDGSKCQKADNHVEDSLPTRDPSLKPIESLYIIMEDLRKTTDDQPTQKLVQDMEVALERLSKLTTPTSEASVDNKLSSERTLVKKLPHVSSKNNERQNGMKIAFEEPHTVDTEIAHSSVKCSTVDHNGIASDAGAKEYNFPPLVSQEENKQTKFAVADRFELLVKLSDDESARRQHVLGNDEKLKAEIEYLNKQLNLQLKSVEGLSTKESEYQKLIAGLIEKVDKLEAQVNEQSKVAQHFYAQSSALLEQNSTIPTMQKNYDHLNKQLQETIRNYEKLKVEYCMMKLEKDKYYALSCEKDKTISQFKQEIMKIQSLVTQQIENVKNYVGYSSAAEKVDTLLDIIDTQSNLIKSRISKAGKDLDEVSIPAVETPSSSLSGPQSRPVSPFSSSVKLNSPDKIYKSLNGAAVQEEYFK